jgi:hypothetical protein
MIWGHELVPEGDSKKYDKKRPPLKRTGVIIVKRMMGSISSGN